MTVSTKPFNLHPKVYNSTMVLLAAGLVFVVLGVLLDEEQLRTLGYATLGSSIAALTVGYVSPPADSEVTIGPASDDLLNDRAASHLRLDTASEADVMDQEPPLTPDPYRE